MDLRLLGYTSCPDICPATLQNLNFAYPKLKQIDDRARIALMSVDPLRDTAEKLALYINYFNPEFVAMTGDHATLYPLAREMGMMYSIVDTVQESYYTVDHSASVVLFNPAGNIAAVFKTKHALGEIPTVNPADVVEDFDRIVALSEG